MNRDYAKRISTNHGYNLQFDSLRWIWVFTRYGEYPTIYITSKEMDKLTIDEFISIYINGGGTD